MVDYRSLTSPLGERIANRLCTCNACFLGPLSPNPGLTYSALIDGCHPNNWYLYEGSVPSINANCPPNVVGFKCGKLKNITNVNAPGIQDSHRETVIAYAMFDLTETLTLRYNFGWADILQAAVATTTIRTESVVRRMFSWRATAWCRL